MCVCVFFFFKGRGGVELRASPCFLGGLGLRACCSSEAESEIQLSMALSPANPRRPQEVTRASGSESFES